MAGSRRYNAGTVNGHIAPSLARKKGVAIDGAQAASRDCAPIHPLRCNPLGNLGVRASCRGQLRSPNSDQRPSCRPSKLLPSTSMGSSGLCRSALDHAARRAARISRSHRNQERLRPRSVRGLHGAGRWAAGRLLPDARRERRRPSKACRPMAGCTRCSRLSLRMTASDAAIARRVRSARPSG